MNNPISDAYKTSYEKLINGTSSRASNKLIIPDFQRNFVWSRKKITKFLDSMIESDDLYYIGNMVIQNGNGSSSWDKVIDGQQRLVTLSLILKCILDNTGDKSDKLKIENILFVPTSSLMPRLKFTRKGMDEIYKEILLNDIGKIVKPDDKILQDILNKFKYIKGVVAKKYHNEMLSKIKKLQIVVVKISSGHNAVSIYEGLNSTGKPLKPLELIKSIIVGGGAGNHIFWQKMEENFSKRNPIWFDKFIRSHLFTIVGYVSNDNLYEKAKKEFKQKKEYKNELEYYSSVYLSLRDAEIKEKFNPWKNMRSKEEIRYILKGIRALKLDQVYAPLVALIKYGKTNEYYLKEAFFYEDLFKIWSFLLLFKFSDINPNKIERKFASFCKNICDNSCSKAEFKKIKTNFYKNLEEVIQPESVFTKKLLEIIKYSAKSKNNIGNKDIVESILAFYLLNDEKRIIPETCDVEHIFPEGDDWSDWNIDSKAKCRLVDQGLRYSLGNLTLLIPKDNDKAKNKKFSFKYEKVYSKDKKFKKNKKLSVYSDVFNSKDPSRAVSKRGKDMGSFLYKKLKQNLK